MKSQIETDLKAAQLSRDELRTSVLRMLLSELRYAQISKGQELTEPDYLQVIQKEVKKRREAAEGFRKGDRAEQAEKEESEAKILEGYLPEQLSDEELTTLVETTITEVGASSITDMGKVLGIVMPKVSGRAEGARVSTIVKAILTS